MLEDNTDKPTIHRVTVRRIIKKVSFENAGAVKYVGNV